MFEKRVEKYRLYNPMAGKEEEVEVEVRFDPLTKKPTRIVKKPLPFTKDGEFEEDLKKPCPFCEDVIEKVAARDIEVLGGELKRRGESIIFANISPYARFSLVVRLCKAHYLKLSEFNPDNFFDSFKLCAEYLEKVRSDYATITMNYLKPAGSSVVHPHLQLIVSEELMDYQSRVVQSAETFYKVHKKQFWDVIEDKDELVVMKGNFLWFAPFAPRGFDHVSAYSKKPITDMSDEELRELSDGIVRILRAYDELGYNSFNFGVFTSLKNTPYFGTLFDIVARTPFDRYYWCDVFAITKIYDEAYTNKPPEETAKFVRKFFG